MDNIADHWILSAIFDRTRKEHPVESNQPEKRNQVKRFSKPNSNRFNSNVKQRRREAQSRKVTEKELTALHHKIVSTKLFSSLFLNHDIIHIVYIRKNKKLR